MELEEMKRTWGQIGRQLEEQITLNRAIVREAMAKRASDRLRPLKLGQMAQIVFGFFVIILSLAYYLPNQGVPHRFIAGVVMQIYGTSTVILGGKTLASIRAIDWCEPVAEIQRKLEWLRMSYFINSILAGLTWWVLWVPFLQVVCGLAGFDVYATMPWMFLNCIRFGIVGLFATWALHAWSKRPGRESLRRRLEEEAAGASIMGAFDELSRIREFEIQDRSDTDGPGKTPRSSDQA